MAINLKEIFLAQSQPKASSMIYYFYVYFYIICAAYGILHLYLYQLKKKKL